MNGVPEGAGGQRREDLHVDDRPRDHAGDQREHEPVGQHVAQPAHDPGDDGARLREKRLELRQIQNSGIYFDLAEIGVDRSGEGETRGQAVLQVEARIEPALRRLHQRIVMPRAHVGTRDAVRHDFEAALRMDAFDSGQVGKARDED